MQFTLSRFAAFSAMVALALAAIACGGSGLEGTYTNANGLATLELKSGGEATFAMMGENYTCTYAEDDAKLTLTCPGQDALAITVHDDGSLTPDGTFIGAMKKSE
jgi:hypothetical protein